MIAHRHHVPELLIPGLVNVILISVDPWEDDNVAAKMKAFKSFETAILKGEGGKILPKQVALTARKRYPGNSLKAIVGRLNYYNSTVR